MVWYAMSKVAMIIRKITIPPVFAVVLLLSVYFSYPEQFGAVWHMIGGIVFFAILPVLAYPLQKYIPGFKNKGRDGQRSLAMIFSFAGYLLGTVVAFAFSANTIVKIIYLEYLFCGITMLVFNKLFKLKASGHACGVIGPMLLMIYFKLYIAAAVCALFAIPVFIASVHTKRHTPMQLLGGALIPLAMLIIVDLIF